MKTLLFNVLLMNSLSAFAQHTVRLENPSFEADRAQCCTTPSGWYFCGAWQGSPDIQPGTSGVDRPAAEGDNYLSLLVQDDGFTQAIGQALSRPLKRDSMYILRFSCARSLQLMAPTKNSAINNSYATPGKLKIWGGNGPCDAEQLLAETSIISNPEWIEIELTLQPHLDLTHIFLEASHKTPNLFPYNGNVLIDNLSLSQIP